MQAVNLARCPSPDGAYNHSLLPYFDYRTHQVELVQHLNFEVIQVVAEHVNNALFFGWDNWSPSCRYFVYAVGSFGSNETIIWDTVEQKQVGVFHRKAKGGLYFLDWGDSDNYLIVGTIVG